MSRKDKIVDAMQGLTLRGFGALCAVETSPVIASTNGQPPAPPTEAPPWVVTPRQVETARDGWARHDSRLRGAK